MKHLVITRGLPGTGKTHIAKKIIETAERTMPDIRVSIYSADDFWYQNGHGHYKYEHRKLPLANEWNLKRFEKAIQRKDDLVVVDNIHIKVDDMLPYAKVAAAADYTVDIAASLLPPYSHLELLEKRNTHGVRLWILEMFWQEWEDCSAEELIRRAKDAG